MYHFSLIIIVIKIMSAHIFLFVVAAVVDDVLFFSLSLLFVVAVVVVCLYVLFFSILVSLPCIDFTLGSVYLLHV